MGKKRSESVYPTIRCCCHLATDVWCRGSEYYHGMNYYRRRKPNPHKERATGSFQTQCPARARQRGGVVVLLSQSCGPNATGPPRAAQAIRPPRHSLALGRLHNRVRFLTGPGANEPFCCPKGSGPGPRRRGRIFASSRFGGARGYVSAHCRNLPDGIHSRSRRYVDVCVCLCAPRRTQRLSARLMLVS